MVVVTGVVEQAVYSIDSSLQDLNSRQLTTSSHSIILISTRPYTLQYNLH